jgi:hypothetical protein
MLVGLLSTRKGLQLLQRVSARVPMLHYGTFISPHQKQALAGLVKGINATTAWRVRSSSGWSAGEVQQWLVGG